MKFIEQYRSAKEQGVLRPWWQIVILLPLFLLYIPANAFVEWMDNL